jgi:hypothetical protein
MRTPQGLSIITPRFQLMPRLERMQLKMMQTYSASSLQIWSAAQTLLQPVHDLGCWTLPHLQSPSQLQDPTRILKEYFCPGPNGLSVKCILSLAVSGPSPRPS